MIRRRKQHEEEHMDESWLIPYADLLTLLLALFIILFASSNVDSKRFEELRLSFNAAFHGGTSFFENSTPSPSGDEIGIQPNNYPSSTLISKEEQEQLEQILEETRQLEALQSKIQTHIDENGLQSHLHTELDANQLKLTIPDRALFASGSAVVRQDSRDLTLTIAELLEQYPDYEIVISGHTDNVPINTARFESNWDLSSARALNFMKLLFQNAELDPSRFSSVGYGEYRPLADNSDAKGRAQNRRVEISILRNFDASRADDF